MNKSLALCAGFAVMCSALLIAPAFAAETATLAATSAPAAKAPEPAPAPVAAAPAAAAPVDATAPSLETLLSGNTLLYKDGKSMGAEYYGADGRYAHSEGDKGIWSVNKAGKVCIADTSENRCWTGVINGQSVMWYDEQGDFEGTGNLVKGNPTGL